MLAFINNHKKGFFICSLAIVVALMSLVFIFFPTENEASTIVRLAALIVGTAVIINLLILRFGNIIIATKFFSVALVIIVMTAIGVVLQNIITLPEYIDGSIISSVTSVITVFLLVVFPIPRIAGEYVRKKLGLKQVTVNPVKNTKKPIKVCNDSSKNTEQFTFELYRMVRSSYYASNLRKKYGIKSIADYYARLLFLIVGAFTGILSIVVAFNINQGTFDAWMTVCFWLIAGGVSLLIIAISVVILGFFYSLCTTAICGSLCGIVFFLVSRYKNIAHLPQTKTKFWILTVLLAVIFLIIIYYLLDFALAERRRTVTYYKDENQNIIGVDVSLKKSMPIENYNTLYEIEITMDDDVTSKTLNSFMDSTLENAFDNDYIIMGIKVAEEKFFIYALLKDDSDQIDVLESYLDKKINFEYTVTRLRNDIQNFYMTILYPSRTMEWNLYNTSVVERYRKRKYDLEKKYPIIFITHFKNKKSAQSFVEGLYSEFIHKEIIYNHKKNETIIENELKQLSNTDKVNEKIVCEEDQLDFYPYVVELQLDMSLSVHDLNAVCKEILNGCDQNDGLFEKWVIINDVINRR